MACERFPDSPLHTKMCEGGRESWQYPTHHHGALFMYGGLLASKDKISNYEHIITNYLHIITKFVSTFNCNYVLLTQICRWKQHERLIMSYCLHCAQNWCFCAFEASKPNVKRDIYYVEIISDYVQTINNYVEINFSCFTLGLASVKSTKLLIIIDIGGGSDFARILFLKLDPKVPLGAIFNFRVDCIQ